MEKGGLLERLHATRECSRLPMLLQQPRDLLPLLQTFCSSRVLEMMSSNGLEESWESMPMKLTTSVPRLLEYPHLP